MTYYGQDLTNKIILFFAPLQILHYSFEIQSSSFPVIMQPAKKQYATPDALKVFSKLIGCQGQKLLPLHEI